VYSPASLACTMNLCSACMFSDFFNASFGMSICHANLSGYRLRGSHSLPGVRLVIHGHGLYWLSLTGLLTATPRRVSPPHAHAHSAIR
jgi:hypothetical protein